MPTCGKLGYLGKFCHPSFRKSPHSGGIAYGSGSKCLVTIDIRRNSCHGKHLDDVVCKYSPNLWSTNASHPEKPWKSGDSNLTLHPFGEYLLSSGSGGLVEQPLNVL